jgi:hypothetical protein
VQIQLQTPAKPNFPSPKKTFLCEIEKVSAWCTQFSMSCELVSLKFSLQRLGTRPSGHFLRTTAGDVTLRIIYCTSKPTALLMSHRVLYVHVTSLAIKNCSETEKSFASLRLMIYFSSVSVGFYFSPLTLRFSRFSGQPNAHIPCNWTTFMGSSHEIFMKYLNCPCGRIKTKMPFNSSLMVANYFFPQTENCEISFITNPPPVSIVRIITYDGIICR